MSGNNPKGGGGGGRGQSTPNKRPPPPSSTASDRKSRWESSSSSSKPSPNKPLPTSNNKPSPSTKQHPAPTKPNPNPSPARSGPRPPFPLNDPLPPPTYGFHMLDRRTIVLADGSVRSYFALPPDYQDFFGPARLPPLGPMSPDGHPMKRKFGFGEPDERGRERDEYARQKQQLLQYGNAGAGPGTSSPFRREEEGRAAKLIRLGNGGGEGFDGRNLGMMRHHQDAKVDPAVMKAFLRFVKVINENVHEKKNYLDNGKHGPLKCIACTRSSKDFPDVHSLVVHSYSSDNADLRADHLGLHRALCVLMGWSYMRPPDNSRAYQFLPADEAAACQDDLIMWPPMVIIHNTNTGKSKDGRIEGLGNKAMDGKLRDLGFSGGKSKSLYNREGHLGITLIKFAADQSGLKDAIRLAEHFQKEHHGRRDWAHLQSIGVRWDDENNPNLVMVDVRTGERSRILYGYLLTVWDLDKVDFDTRKKAVIESKREKLQPSS